MNIHYKTIGVYSCLVFIGIIVGCVGSGIVYLNDSKPTKNSQISDTKTQISSVPETYKIPIHSGGLNLSYYFGQAMKNSNTLNEIQVPTYRYMRALMYDMFVSYPGRDEFVDCIKNPDFVIDPEKTTLDAVWRKACSAPVPKDGVFPQNNPDLLERYRLQLSYLSFRKEDISHCKKLLDIKIQTPTGVIQSDEFESYVTCNAAAQRKDYAINAAYFRMTQAVEKNQCVDLRDKTMIDLCTAHRERTKK